MATWGGRRVEQLRLALIAAGEHMCCRCDHPIDTALPATHPAGPTVDHWPMPRSMLAPREWYDITRCKLSHNRHNAAANSRPGHQAIAQPEPRSRDW